MAALDDLLDLVLAPIARSAIGNLFEGVRTADGFHDLLGGFFLFAIVLDRTRFGGSNCRVGYVRRGKRFAKRPGFNFHRFKFDGFQRAGFIRRALRGLFDYRLTRHIATGLAA